MKEKRDRAKVGEDSLQTVMRFYPCEVDRED